MKALIVCHAGRGVGLGHLTRSLVVAGFLRAEFNADIKFLIQGDRVQRPDLNEFSHQFLAVDENLIGTIRQQVWLSAVQVVILDLHSGSVPSGIVDLLQSLRQSGCKIVSIDGLVSHRTHLDLLFIPSFRFTPPENLCGYAPIFFGWDCFLLNVANSPVDWKLGKRALVLSGGSDTTGLGKIWPALLNETLPDDSELHWVTGPYAQQPLWPDSLRISMVNHQSPAGLNDVIVGVNFALTVYGVSFYELLYYGVPTVVFSPYGEKDDVELAMIAEEEVALVAKNEFEAVAKLQELMANEKLAASLSRRARQKMSTPGGQTFARALAALMVE